jgi:tRNA(Met) cytidine acetyltransferase
LPRSFARHSIVITGDAPETSLAAIRRVAAELSARARGNRHRRALCLAGSPAWTLAAARAALEAPGTGRSDVLWISDRAPADQHAIRCSEAQGVLGSEVDHAVFDAYSGFDPDAFGAVSGTLRAGGLLVLLTPALEDWPGYEDPEKARITVHPHPPEAVTGRYIGRFAHILMQDSDCVVVEEPGEPPDPGNSQLRGDLPRFDQTGPGPETIYRTDDQRIAVESVLKVATGHRRRPAVLTSDRGRGKSAALGIAAALLLERGKHRIVVTGPSMSTTAPLFRHAAGMLSGSTVRRGRILHGAGEIRFIAPDALVSGHPPADLVLVDEAAAIPAPMLETLLARYARIAFATTVHGYEGTGMGFSVRFHDALNRRANRWRSIELKTPVRWADNDPLERLVFRALLLDADPAAGAALASTTPGACTVERLDRAALANDERSLSELFGLLVLAHYQTRPADLRHLLDGPNLSVYVSRHRGHVVATALVATEGGFNAEAASAIYENRRRPHGHLLPETLAVHLGIEEAPLQRGIRVMRIAVHPALQGRGIGTQLLNDIVREHTGKGSDWVGASFGATTRLLRFWERSGLSPVRIGFRRGTTSGSHSAVVIRGLTAEGCRLVTEARVRFVRDLPEWLSDPLKHLEPELTASLLIRDTPLLSDLDAGQWRDIVSFAFSRRGYEVNLGPIRALTGAALSHREGQNLLDAPLLHTCILRVLQRRNALETATFLGLAGTAAVTERLRHAMRILACHYGGDTVRDAAARSPGQDP